MSTPASALQWGAPQSLRQEITVSKVAAVWILCVSLCRSCCSAFCTVRVWTPPIIEPKEPSGGSSAPARSGAGIGAGRGPAPADPGQRAAHLLAARPGSLPPHGGPAAVLDAADPGYRSHLAVALICRAPTGRRELSVSLTELDNPGMLVLW